MLSGVKEILIVVCVLVGLFMLPRLMRRRQNGNAGKATAASRGSGDGLLRLALLLSALWIGLALILLNPLKGDMLPFLGAGVLPVAAGWGVRWVLLGFK